MEHCPTQAVLPSVGLAADKVIRDRYIRALTAIGPTPANPDHATMIEDTD
ncbi:MAG: hypothetical protein ACQESR_23220 [Planctomycetota bacterium]